MLGSLLCVFRVDKVSDLSGKLSSDQFDLACRFLEEEESEKDPQVGYLQRYMNLTCGPVERRIAFAAILDAVRCIQRVWRKKRRVNALRRNNSKQKDSNNDDSTSECCNESSKLTKSVVQGGVYKMLTETVTMESSPAPKAKAPASRSPPPAGRD